MVFFSFHAGLKFCIHFLYLLSLLHDYGLYIFKVCPSILNFMYPHDGNLQYGAAREMLRNVATERM